MYASMRPHQLTMPSISYSGTLLLCATLQSAVKSAFGASRQGSLPLQPAAIHAKHDQLRREHQQLWPRDVCHLLAKVR